MNFQYNYNLSGRERKPLIDAISQMLDQPAVYQGAPSFAYTFGDYTVSRNGVLSCKDNINPENVSTLVEALRERGFVAENVDDTADTDTADSESPNTLTIEISDTGFTPESRENLKKIVASKKTILEKALGADTLPIVEKDGKIAFPWFTLHGLEEEADAYSRLIAAICKMAKEQKRVTATEKPVENAKFNMRLFLVRLGFIGDEYKTARKILLRNLTGNSAWKSGYKPEWLAGNIETGTTTTNAGYTDVDVPAEEAPVDIETSEFLEDKNGGGENYGK